MSKRPNRSAVTSAPTTFGMIDILACGLIILLTAATFQSVLKHQFLAWDDDIEITRNAHVQGWTAENVRWMLTDTAQTMRYIPLSWLNWATLVSLFGLNPFWFHLEALLFHIANGVLVYILIRRLLVLSAPYIAFPHLTAVSALAALTWVLHPLRTEVVAWVTQERFAQALFFSLLAVLSYLSFVQAAHLQRRYFYLAAVTLSSLAALTYPTGALVIGLLLLLDFYPLRRLGERSLWSKQTRHLCLEKLPFLLAPVVVWSVTVIARLSSNASYEPAPTLTQFGLLPRLMQAFYVYAYYAWRPLVPWGLSPVYTRLIHFSPLEPIFLVSAILVLGLSILALRVVRRLPALSVLWAAHLLLIAPMLGLLEKPHYTSDRYAYAQGVLWAVGVAALLSVALRFSRPGALAAYAVLTCVCLYLGVLGVRQSRIWRDSVTLFKYTINSIQDDPLRSDLHSRLGLAYLVRGQSDDLAEAVIELTKYPAPSEAMLTAGWILLDHKRPEAAAAVVQKALDAPADPLLVSRLRNALGVALSRTNNFPAAEAELMESVRLDPSYLEARSNLGQCLMAEGKHDLAIEQFRTLVQLSNGNPNSLRLLNEAIARARGAG